MSPKSRGRPPGRGRPQRPKQTRVPTRAELVVRDARYVVEECDDALSAELWASGVLGEVWVEAPVDDDRAEHRLILGVAELAGRRPGPTATAAVAALRLVTDGTDREALTAVLDVPGPGGPAPPWASGPGWTPVAAHRCVDVWGSERVLFVDFDGPQPHCLLAVVSEVPGRWVTELEILEPGSAVQFDDRPPGSADCLLPVQECDVAEVLADLADALRSTDLLWPRADDPDYVELRAMAWARAKPHLAPPADPPAPTGAEARRELVEAFAAGGDLPDDELTRALAELFVDHGDAYLPGGPLGWNPDSVEYFLTEWLPRSVGLTDDERAALPGALGHWVRFALTRQGLDPEWIEPVAEAVAEYTPAFESAYDSEAESAPAQQLVAELLARGIDLRDEAAVEAALRAWQAEQSEQAAQDDPR